jgi:hypothetical protein
MGPPGEPASRSVGFPRGPPDRVVFGPLDGQQSPAQLGQIGTQGEKAFRLNRVPPKPNSKIEYLDDDAGDDWRHEITLKKSLTPDDELAHQVCLDGAGDDSVGGYNPRTPRTPRTRPHRPECDQQCARPHRRDDPHRHRLISGGYPESIENYGATRWHARR